jgi:hypothetical protein
MPPQTPTEGFAAAANELEQNIDAAVAAAHDHAAETSPAPPRKRGATTIAETAAPSSGDSGGNAGAGAKVADASAPLDAGSGGQRPAPEQAAGPTSPASGPAADLFRKDQP